MTNYLILQIAILLVVAVASVVDLRTTKIPNWLTFGSAPIGIILNFALLGWKAGLLAIAGWCTGVIIMIGFKKVGKMNQMGMGDVKLIAAIGAFLRLEVLLVWGYFALLFGAFATFKFLTAIPWSHFGKMVKAASVGLPSTLDQEAAVKLTAVMTKPVALAPIIALGTLMAILLEKPTLAFLGFPIS
jgi:prepilin signal peptidase PulO-like enzyme (type II secretory pathway)